jgi:hypothetical protein
MSDVRMEYDFLYGSLALLLTVCAFALFRKQQWSYAISVAANTLTTCVSNFRGLVAFGLS